MLIDWFTVGAQVLNFLILVWLLKHFLYKPILNAIDAREKRIAAELADAAAGKAAADKARDEFLSQSKVLEEQHNTLFARARDDARCERERLMTEARREADGLRAKQESAMRNDRTRLGGEMTRLATKEVFAIARKALADLAAASLEERMGEVFTRRLHDMDSKAKDSLGIALRTSREPALVRSTFDMPAKERATIQNALNETFSAEVRLRFETSPDTLCGIELTANGQKLAWSIAEYLAALEERVGMLLDAEISPAPRAVSPPAPVAQAATAAHATTT